MGAARTTRPRIINTPQGPKERTRMAGESMERDQRRKAFSPMKRKPMFIKDRQQQYGSEAPSILSQPLSKDEAFEAFTGDGKFGETRVDLVDEQDNPIGLDRSSEFGADDFYTINQLHIPVDNI